MRPAAEKKGGAEGGFVVVNFYGWHAFGEDVVEAAAEVRACLRSADVRGRIYLSATGLNAQYSGPYGDAVAYAEWVRAWVPPGADGPPFADVRVSVQPLNEAAHAFPRLAVRVKGNLLPLAGGMDGLDLSKPERRAEELAPADWEAKLRETAHLPPDDPRKPLVLDVRNAYEWDLGHFEGAARPRVNEFRDTPVDAASFADTGWDVDALVRMVEASNASTSASPSPAPKRDVLMYCTGGIRCDAYSAALRARGYDGSLYTLEGGVHNYFRKLGADERSWEGSLYVFDARGAVSSPRIGTVHGPLTEDGAVPAVADLPAAVPCEICGAAEAETPHTNCALMDCNRHFLACSACRARWGGCCSAACEEKGTLLNRLRPPLRAGNYRRMGQYNRADGKPLVRLRETAEG